MKKEMENRSMVEVTDYRVEDKDCTFYLELFKKNRCGESSRSRMQARLQRLMEKLGELFPAPPPDIAVCDTETEEHESGYRLISGYRVREIFTGEDSLTSVLTRYMERTVALNY